MPCFKRAHSSSDQGQYVLFCTNFSFEESLHCKASMKEPPGLRKSETVLRGLCFLCKGRYHVLWGQGIDGKTDLRMHLDIRRACNAAQNETGGILLYAFDGMLPMPQIDGEIRFQSSSLLSCTIPLRFFFICSLTILTELYILAQPPFRSTLCSPLVPVTFPREDC